MTCRLLLVMEPAVTAAIVAHITDNWLTKWLHQIIC